MSGEPMNIDELDQRATEIIRILLAGGLRDPSFQSQLRSVGQFGRQPLEEVADSANRVLRDKERNGAQITQLMGEVRSQAERLEPKNDAGPFGGLARLQQWLGLASPERIPRGYFDRYRKAQPQLDRLLRQLYSVQDDLLRDNARLTRERERLEQAKDQLKRYIELGLRLDAGLQQRLPEVDDQQRKRVLEQEFLFNLRRRLLDLQTQHQLALQSIASVELLIANNRELAQGVERTTLSLLLALRTAITVADALGGQRLVLEQVQLASQRSGATLERMTAELAREAATTDRETMTRINQLGELRLAFRDLQQVMAETEAVQRKALTAPYEGSAPRPSAPLDADR